MEQLPRRAIDRRMTLSLSPNAKMTKWNGDKNFELALFPSPGRAKQSSALKDFSWIGSRAELSTVE